MLFVQGLQAKMQPSSWAPLWRPEQEVQQGEQEEGEQEEGELEEGEQEDEDGELDEGEGEGP